MGTHWARQQAKRDELRDSLEIAVIWVQKNRKIALAIAGGIALVLLFTGIAYESYRARSDESWNQLAMARAYAYSGHGDEAVKMLEQMADEHPGSPAAAYGLLFEGDIFYPQGKYDDALKAYSRVLAGGAPETAMPFALSDKVVTEEAAGKCQDAAKDAQNFLDTYPDHFLAPLVHMSLARCLDELGQKDEAKVTYQKIALQYPGTSWAEEAQAKIQPAAPAK